MAMVVAQSTPAAPGYGRAFGRVTVFASRYGTTVPLAGATVRAYVPGTATPWTGALYDDESATAPVAFPILADASGAVALWAAEPDRVELECVYAGYGAQRIVLDLEFPPDYVDPDPDPYPQYATQADLAEHKAAPDDHPGYLTPSEGSALFLPLAHEPGVDPHGQYLTVARGDALFLTPAEGDARYALLGGSGITQDQADLRYEPIDTMYTKAESDAKYALATALTAALARITTLESQVATLNTRMTGHTHQSGTVQNAGGTAIVP
jgi:hypothetical protein